MARASSLYGPIPVRKASGFARLDGGLPPAQVSSERAVGAFFGPAGTIVFQAEEGQAEYLFRVREDGSGRQKVTADPVIWVMSVSPGGRWAVVWTQGSADAPSRPLVAYPLGGGDGVRLCDNCAGVNGPTRGNQPPMLTWSPDGHYLYITLQTLTPIDRQYETGRTYAVRLARASALPPAFTDETDVASIPGVLVIPHGGIFPGPTPSLYAYTRTTTHRNIYRIPVP